MAYRSEYTPVVRSLECLRGISTLTAFGLAVEIGDWNRFTGSTIGAYLGLVPDRAFLRGVPVPGLDHQDRQHPRPPAAGRGGLAPPQTLRPSSPDRCGPGGSSHRGGPGPRPCQGNRRLHHRWDSSPNAANDPSSRTSPSPGNWPAGAGPWPPARDQTGNTQWIPLLDAPGPDRRTLRGFCSAWSKPAIRLWAARNTATPDIARPAEPSSRTPRPAVTNPRISV